MATQAFSKDVLHIDAESECRKIEQTLRDQVGNRFRKKGAVIGLSGGIDSSVTVALCARAFGSNRVLVLFMPEHDSSDDSLDFGRLVAEKFGVPTVLEEIGPFLDAAGCYKRRDDAIRKQLPEYGPEYKSKLVLASILDTKGFNYFHLVVQSPKGEQKKIRLDAQTYLEIVAATNMKQRARKFFEYYHADRLNYAVAGTPNRLEYDQGFFVKNGDGAADFKPIAHLYKSQVYQLAAYLEIPPEVLKRPPTTDTYSLAQSQEEFYFALPYDQMDLCLYAKDHGISPSEVAPVIERTEEQVLLIYDDIERKRSVARYLHSSPLLVEDISTGGNK